MTFLKRWLDEEQTAGAPNPNQAVLATMSEEGAHSRVVAIREIAEEGFIFFTQANTRKVEELMRDVRVSLNYWFPLNQRQVVIEGAAEALSENDNYRYWHEYSKEAQARFAAYAPTSSQAIEDKRLLEEKKERFMAEYAEQAMPLHPLYKGFLIRPSRMVFYAYRTDELSDVVEYVLKDNRWQKRLLSP